MNEILTSDGALLWRGPEPPLKMAVLLTRQRPWLEWRGATLVRGDRWVVLNERLIGWIAEAAIDGGRARKLNRGVEHVIGHSDNVLSPRCLCVHRCEFCRHACKPHLDCDPCNLSCGCVEAMWRCWEMVAEVKLKRYFACPNGCDHEFVVEHLFLDLELGRHGYGSLNEQSAGPWYCDSCGQGWNIVVHRDGRLDVDEAKPRLPEYAGKKKDLWVTLEIPPQTKPIRLRVRGMCFTQQIDMDAERFYYEENACPTNYLRAVDAVWLGDEEDPHGLAVLVDAKVIGSDLN